MVISAVVTVLNLLLTAYLAVRLLRLSHEGRRGPEFWLGSFLGLRFLGAGLSVTLYGYVVMSLG